MKKILREITRTCREAGCDLVEIGQHRAHYRVSVRKGQRAATLTVSCTPKNLDHTLKNFRRDLDRYVIN